MKKALALVVLTAGALLMGGCADDPPTYEEVRAETDDVLEEVAALVPDPKEIVPTEGIQPYSCSNSLTFGTRKGSFYTGQRAVFVDESFDVPSFIARFPDVLGPGWRAESLGVPVTVAQIYLVHDSPRVSLGIRETTIDGRKAIDLLAMSRCGIVTDGAGS